MTADLVIFDCDGVLVDTEPATNRVIAANLTRHGLPIDQHQVHSLFAGGTIALVKEEALRRGADLPDNWVDGMYAETFAVLREGAPVIDGVMDLLDALDAAGVTIAIASNGPLAKMDISLKPSGLLDRFAGRIYSGHDHGPKPKPDMLLQIMADFGVSPERSVMIDDMPAGFEAARAAGIRCFGYVGDGDPDRIGDTGAVPFTAMAGIGRALGLG